MEKKNKIIYWFSTIWLSLGMISSAIVQIFKFKGDEFTAHLGYPSYFLTMLGFWKIAGVAALLIPGFRLIKEWAYAGFFFVMSGAVLSHIATGTVNQMFPSMLLLILTIISWYFRPLITKQIQLL